MKKRVKIKKFLISVTFVEIVFVPSVTLSPVITESPITLIEYLRFSLVQLLGFQIFNDNQHHTMFYRMFSLTSTFIAIPLNFTFDLVTFSTINLHLHLHDINFANVFESFIFVILLNPLYIFKFTSSILFGIHILLDKLSRALQRPLHLSKLIL